jgi:hypothetical protein
LLLSIGALAAFSSLSLLSHQGDIPNWGIILTILLLTFFISWTWALFIYLRWRDRRSLATPTNPTIDLAALKGTVYGLVPGAEYRVMQTFTDYYNNQFQSGEILHFKERHFLPYPGGHTIIFHERPSVSAGGHQRPHPLQLPLLHRLSRSLIIPESFFANLSRLRAPASQR